LNKSAALGTDWRDAAHGRVRGRFSRLSVLPGDGRHRPARAGDRVSEIIETAVLDEPDRTKTRNRIITTAFLTLLVVLSGGYDFWRGYRHEHSVYEGLLFAMLGFIVLGVIFILFSDRGGR